MAKLFYSNKQILKFSVAEYIKIYLSPNAGLQGTLFIIVTQQSRLWWFYLDHISTTIMVGGRVCSESNTSYYIVCLKVMYFPSSNFIGQDK